MDNYTKRFANLFLGLFFYGIGVFLAVKSNIGLPPWDCFHDGISRTMGISYGNANVLVGFIVLIITFFLKEKIGFGTIFNTIVIGKLVDLFSYLNFFPIINNLFIGIIVMLTGHVFIALGSYFYFKSGTGLGPRDSLMVALLRRFPNVSIGVIRGALESCALVLGWLLGGKAGVGTFVTIFGISSVIQLVFSILKFNSTDIVHESCIDTIKILKAKYVKA